MLRFEFTHKLSYLLLANQHTALQGQGPRDLCQTQVKPYWIEIVGHSTTIHTFSIPLRIFNRLKKYLFRLFANILKHETWNLLEHERVKRSTQQKRLKWNLKANLAFVWVDRRSGVNYLNTVL